MIFWDGDCASQRAGNAKARVQANRAWRENRLHTALALPSSHQRDGKA